MISDYIDLVEGTYSGDNLRRSSSESKIETLRQTHVDELASNLIDVASASDSTSVTVSQSALLVLKQVIKKTWSVGFEEFAGPHPISFEVKDDIKRKLLGLLHSPQRAVSSASALILAQIASVEFPEEWPELGGIVLQLLTPPVNGDGSVSGGLTLLREMLDYTISDKEFFQMGLELTERLYLIFTSDNVELQDKAVAVQCFTLCVLFFDAVGNGAQAEAVEKLAKQIVATWSKPLSECISKPIGPSYTDENQVHYRSLKVACYNLLLQLSSTFRWFNKSYLIPLFLPASWTDLLSAAPDYLNYVVRNTAAQEPQASVDLRAAVTRWIISILDVLNVALKHKKSGLSDVASSETDVYECIATLAMIPADTQELWTENFNEFVSAEFDEFDVGDIRPQLPHILYKSGIPLDTVVKSLAGYISDSDFVLTEAVLNLIGGILNEVDDLGVSDNISASTKESLVNCFLTAMSIVNASSPLVLSRVLLFGGAVAKHTNNSDFELQFVQKAIDIASSSDNDLIRLCAIVSISNSMSTDVPSVISYLKSEQGKLFGWISSLSEDAEDETPALLVDSLIKVMKLSVEASVTEESVVLLLYKLASVDMSNIELTFSVNEALTFLVESAVQSGNYEVVCNNAVPQLLQIVYESKATKWEYSPQLELALDLIVVIVESGPPALPNELIQVILDPIYEVIMTSDEAAVLQSASQCVPFLIQKGSEFIRQYQSATTAKSGLEMVIDVAARLLDPSGDTKEGQSRGIYASKVISEILSHYGAVLTGDLLTQIIAAASSRLISSENVVLTESFIILFSELFVKSFDQMLEGLWSIDQGKSFAAVLDKWLNSFDVVRGFENINSSVLVMSRIAELNDTRIRSIRVQGDPILANDNVILTRSKTKNLKYTQLSPAEKIVKLFIKELGNVSFEDKLSSQVKKGITIAEDEEDGDDNEEWEDEFDDDDVGHSPDSETQTFIASFLSNVRNDPYFVGIFQRLTPEEQGILASRLTSNQ